MGLVVVAVPGCVWCAGGSFRFGPVQVGLGWDSELECVRGISPLRDFPHAPLGIAILLF